MTRQPAPRPQTPDPDAWLLELIDDDGLPYTPKTNPHDARYQPQTKYTGGDFRLVRAQETDRFPGKPCRIDLVETRYGPAKRIWLAGWMPGDRAADTGPLAAGWTIESASADLQGRGWEVRRWPGGARAWRISRRPVRTGETMRRYRDHLMKDPPAGVNITTLDLLFDL